MNLVLPEGPVTLNLPRSAVNTVSYGEMLSLILLAPGAWEQPWTILSKAGPLAGMLASFYWEVWGKLPLSGIPKPAAGIPNPYLSSPQGQRARRPHPEASTLSFSPLLLDSSSHPREWDTLHSWVAQNCPYVIHCSFPPFTA